MKQKFINSILFLLVVVNVNAQYSKEYEVYKKKYPTSESVVLNRDITIYINIKRGELDIKKDFFEEKLYLSDAAKRNSKENLSFSQFFEYDDLEAATHVFNANKNRYEEIEVTNFKEKDELGEVFHDDVKSINFIYPNLHKGSKTSLKYIEHIKNPRFLSSFYFGDNNPIIQSTYRIIADKNVKLDFKEFNINKDEVSFSEKEKGSKNIYNWQIKNKDEYSYEENTPSFREFLPHIVPIINSYKTSSKQIKVLESTDDLYDWYYSLVKDVNKSSNDKALEATVKELIKDKTTELEKVKAIYYWTQRNIKYIAFEYALGGFIPREANDVYNKKYGDCKDNSSILFKMLEIAGIKSNLTWIGTRKIPYKYNEMPTPAVDNHMILSYTDKNGKTYFLDATGRYSKLGIPTSFIQGKEALIGKGPNSYSIKEVPVMSADKSAIIDSSYISVKENVIEGKSNMSFSGYYKGNYFSVLERLETENETKDFYNNRFFKGNNSFLCKNIKEYNKFDYDKDFNVTYDFSVKEVAKSLGNELYVNLNFNKPLSYYKKKDDRKYDVEYEFKSKIRFYTELKVPNGYSIEYLPENVVFSNDLIKFSLNYLKKDGKVIYEQNLQADFIKLSKDRQLELNKIIKKLEKNYKEVIVLKKNK